MSCYYECELSALAILNNSKRSMMPAGHHSDSDSTLLPLPKSAKTWFGGIFARLREKYLLGCWTNFRASHVTDFTFSGEKWDIGYNLVSLKLSYVP